MNLCVTSSLAKEDGFEIDYIDVMKEPKITNMS